MRIVIIILFFIFFCIPFPARCQAQNGHHLKLYIFCENFPEINIDTITTDTVGLKKYIQKVLAQNKNDSVSFIIECPDHIVFDDITRTENILIKQIDLYKKKGAAVVLYNKCLKELSLPSEIKNRKPADIVITADINGILSIDNKTVTLDYICEKYRGQNISIEIIADSKLTIDKFLEIYKRLVKEDFKVWLGR